MIPMFVKTQNTEGGSAREEAGTPRGPRSTSGTRHWQPGDVEGYRDGQWSTEHDPESLSEERGGERGRLPGRSFESRPPYV